MPIINTIIKRKIDNYADKDSAGNIIIDTYATKDSIPTKISQLENDKKYITNLDLVENAKADASGNIIDQTYALKTSIPTKLSQLINDNNFIDAKSDITGTAARAIGDNNGNIIDQTYATKVSIPTKTSQLVNDSGYITNKSSNIKATLDSNGNSIISTYATKSSIPTKTSQLVNNSGYITNADIVDKAKNDELGNSIIGTYATKSSIPTKLSQLENDSLNINDGLNISKSAFLEWKDSDTSLGSINYSYYTGTANKAVNDINGNAIINTYATKSDAITKLENYQSIITYTKADGTTKSISLPDTKYDIFIGATINTDGTSGLVPIATMSTDIGKKVLCATGKWDIPSFAITSESAIKASQDSLGNIINNTYAIKPITISTAWTSGNESITISNNNITSTALVFIKPASGITKDQYIAFDNAKIECKNQSTGQLEIISYGVIPQIDIPIVIVLFK